MAGCSIFRVEDIGNSNYTQEGQYPHGGDASPCFPSSHGNEPFRYA